MGRSGWERKLGATIKRLRNKKGLSQEEAAHRYGTGVRWWQHLEAGRNLSIDVLRRIGKVLGVEAWRILKGK